MKWDNDHLRYEKYLVFDAIIKVFKTLDGKYPTISVKDVNDFVDEFFEKNNERRMKMQEETKENENDQR